MRFLFCLDLSLHVGAEFFFGILNYTAKQGLDDLAHWPAGRPPEFKADLDPPS